MWPIGSLFHIGVNYATAIREAHPWILYLMPVGGLAIVGLYKLCHLEGKGTNAIIESVHFGESVPILLVPVIFVSTVITHLCGGSAGREGAALQMGGTIGYHTGRLFRLEDRFRRAVGEEPLTEEERERLSAAVRAGQIVFFLAMWETQAVGLCSVSPCFSTFACGEVGSFEDFYLEPDFRGKGAARLLAQAARDWCREEGIASLTVTCAPCDEGMYRALGFDTPLGQTSARLREG